MQIPEEAGLGIIASSIGLGLIAASMFGGGQQGTTPLPKVCPLSGHTLQILATPSDLTVTSVSVTGVPEITLNNPMCSYTGPGLNIFGYWEVKQGAVTVMASGISGALTSSGGQNPDQSVYLGPATTPTSYLMVNPGEPQPCGGTGSILTAIGWQPSPQEWPCGAPFTSPLCGAPPKVGKGDVYIYIFGDQAETGDAADANGLSSPSCAQATYGHTRCPLAMVTFPGAIAFTS